MKIKYMCPYWGSEEMPIEAFVEKVAAYGYDGIEINLPEDSLFISKVGKLLDTHKLDCIAQQWLEPQDESADSYLKRMQKALDYKAEIAPIMINSHTGRDYYSFKDNARIIEASYKFEQQHDIPIVHETHRGRFPYSAMATAAFLREFGDLKLNADFSHWVVVSESFLNEQSEQLAAAISHSAYFHARVGHTQSPQVNDPFAPENKLYLDTFTHWWEAIIQQAKIGGKETFYICPEFGPEPYMPAIPYTNMPIISQWEVNNKMKNYLKAIL
ncbi:sugar phosphate isomerase/epimerase family protein [Saccharicrinis aurantiacus]|uniref:sugar phosphate isomerase/epimerase family protein n=1 Tax=Saccharicrinis aurantiacus TaxID=1849719 RepID=UPI002491D64C|nr:sugar phosphate isomerase/epimerase [Saccharicrinis aurantiacus]